MLKHSASDPISGESRKSLVSDTSSALEAWQTAIDWGVAKAVAVANPFAHTGYKLVSRLLRIDQPLIESLAHELTSQGTIESDIQRKVGWTPMQANSIWMNWKHARCTEYNVDGSRAFEQAARTHNTSQQWSQR
jgi:hypothetical protein